MNVTPFDPADAATVSSWASSAAEVLAWCSGTVAPVPAEVITAWSQAPDVSAFALCADGTLIGYGELWTDDEEAEVELARLIIDPEHRGRGVGRRLATELVSRAVEHHPSVIIRVHPDNVAARRCYAAAGFVPVTADEHVQWNVGQPVTYDWMRWPTR